MTKREKNTYKTVAVVSLLLTTLFNLSCATDHAFLEDDEVPIRLAVTCQEMTRGTSGQSSQETAFDANAKINVTITTSDATPVSICNGAIFTASAPSSGTNTLTPPDQTRPPYYPNGEKTVTIKAYYPSTVNTGTTSFSVATDQTTVSSNETTDTYKSSDLMTAVVTGQVKTANDVNLEFQHRMAKITVTATATDDLTIQSINLANVQTTASYVSATDSWSGTGSTGTITVAKDGSAATLSGVALFPSQTIEGKTFIQVVTNKGTANYAVTSKLFQEGFDYTANLEVGLQNLTLTSAITDWSAATGTATVTKVNKFGMYIEPITGEYTYNGTAQTPATITVKYKTQTEEKTLVKNTDYTLAVYNNTNVGEALVVAEGLKSTNGDFSGSAAVQSFVIGQATPSMTFTSTGTVNQEFAWGGTYTNKLTSESKYDGAVSWTSSDTGVATVDGNGVVSFSKPGTITITVENDGTGNYTKTSAQYTLNITKRSFKNHASITAFGSYDATYTGEEKKPVPVVYDEYDDSTNPATFLQRLFEEQNHFTSAYKDNVNAGTETATITLTGGGIYYDNTTISKTFSITKVTPVITMTTDAKTIGIGATYQCDATTTYGTVTYSSSDENIATVNSTTGLVTVRQIGTATITASVAAGTNWNAATSKTINITGKEQKEEWKTAGAFTYTCPETAVYTFEVVGGAGGSVSRGKGGKGGTVKASKTLTKGTVVYIYVGNGGKGGYSSTAGGEYGSSDGNGGAAGSYFGGSGGASSEIRIGGTAASNRQIVAGGGGGALSWRGAGKDGGSSSAGNAATSNGEAATASTGAGGGGGYLGGKNGAYGGGYGGSNYLDSSWTHISSGVSTNGPASSSAATTDAVYPGYVKMTYAFE